MKTPEERGPIGAWAYQARADVEMSVEQVVEILTTRGAPVRPSTIRGIEGGSKTAGRRLLRELAAIYRSTPPGQPELPPDDLVAALRKQTEAINALVEEMRQSRERDQDAAAAILAAAKALGSLSKRRGSRASTEPDALPVSVR